MKRHVASIMFAAALVSCNQEDNAFVGSGGTGANGTGTTGLTTDFTNLAINSDIPTQIPRAADTSNQNLSVFQRIFASNDASTIVYVGRGATDSDTYIYRADGIGQTQLDTADSDPVFDTMALSGDGSVFVHVKDTNRIFAVNPATQVSTEILTVTTPIYHVALPDDGSLVAFISDEDLDIGENPGGFQQIFTLPTGGGTATQVTSFGADYFDTDSSQLAFTGDGSAILFHMRADLDPGRNTDLSDEVFSINADGTGFRQLSNIDATGDITVIKSSSDGSYVGILIDSDLFVYDDTQSTASGYGALNSTFAGDTTTIDGFSEDQFDISPDGNTVAYFNDKGENFHSIFTAGPTGTSVTEHFITNSTIQGPRLNTNGTTVSFISNGSYGLSAAGNVYQVYTLTF